MEKLVISRKMVPSGFRGITIYPFIFAKDERTANDPRFLNHERIHLRQQAEMLIIPFFLWYVLEYVYRVFQYTSLDKGYRNISMEREAYGNQYNIGYLEKRKFYGWFPYLFKDPFK